MAEKIFKVDEVIEVVYQAPNKETGLGGGGVIAEIYLPSDVKDSNFPDVSLSEIGSSGIYNGTFTPDQQGEWKVVIHKSDGDGQVVKRYSVGAHNVDSVGQVVSSIDTIVADTNADVAAVDGKVTIVDGKVDVVDAKVATVEGKVDDVVANTTSIETKIDSLDTKVSSLDTPPMVS